MKIDDGKDGGHNADKGGGHDMSVDKMIRTMVKRARVVDFL